MLPFTQTELYAILKPQPTQLDIPTFIRRAKANRRMFYLEEQFLMNLKNMICETKSTPRVLDGLLIAGVCLDPRHCCIEQSLAVFNKSILNPIVLSVQQAINQNDIFTDLAVAAMVVFQQLLKIAYKTYEQKTH